MNLKRQESFSLREGLVATALARRQQPARLIVARATPMFWRHPCVQSRSRAQSNYGLSNGLSYYGSALFNPTGHAHCRTAHTTMVRSRWGWNTQQRQLHQASVSAAGRLLTLNDTKAVGCLVRGVRRCAARNANRKIRSTENSAVSAGLPSPSSALSVVLRTPRLSNSAGNAALRWESPLPHRRLGPSPNVPRFE
jgi:hypothetical protein